MTSACSFPSGHPGSSPCLTPTWKQALMCTSHERRAPAQHSTSQLPPAFQQHQGKIPLRRERPLRAGLRSRSRSMLKGKGLQSRPGFGCSSCGQGWRHEGSLCHYLTRHRGLGLCPRPPGFTTGAHKCQRVPLFPPATPQRPAALSQSPEGGFGQGSCAHRNVTFSRWQHKQAVASHCWNSRSDSKVCLILNPLGCSVLLAVGLVLWNTWIICMSFSHRKWCVLKNCSYVVGHHKKLFL